VYEISEVELKKAGWKESVQSLGSYQEHPEQQARDSQVSVESSRASSGTDYASGGGTLTVPAATRSASQNRRSGRSPLARASLIRTAPAEDVELEERPSRPQSPPQRGRR